MKQKNKISSKEIEKKKLDWDRIIRLYLLAMIILSIISDTVSMGDYFFVFGICIFYESIRIKILK